jgi:O-acetylserine/cysteine efflux transporter
MKPVHIAAALLVTVIWGLNFVFIRIGLQTFPPLLLAALRFAVAAVPALFLPRPAIGWPALIAIGATLFVGQFALLFTGMAHGMPPGLASIVAQVQVFLTILIGAVALRERPRRNQVAGAAAAFAGLALIALTVGGDVTVIGFTFSVASALSWAVGNILLRRAGRVDMFALVAWLSLVPPLPLLAMSLALEGPQAIGTAFSHVGWDGIVSVLYIAVLGTTFGYAVFGHLYKHYPVASVAPFTLAVPVFGMGSAAIVFGERFGPLRFAGMALILVGLAAVVLPPAVLRRGVQAVRARLRPG